MATQLLGPDVQAEKHLAAYDCVVQITFRDVQDYLTARDDPYFQKVIAPDHENFADSERTAFLVGWVEDFIVDGVVV